MVATSAQGIALEVGCLRPGMSPLGTLSSGEIGTL